MSRQQPPRPRHKHSPCRKSTTETQTTARQSRGLGGRHIGHLPPSTSTARRSRQLPLSTSTARRSRGPRGGHSDVTSRCLPPTTVSQKPKVRAASVSEDSCISQDIVCVDSANKGVRNNGYPNPWGKHPVFSNKHSHMKGHKGSDTNCPHPCTIVTAPAGQGRGQLAAGGSSSSSSITPTHHRSQHATSHRRACATHANSSSNSAQPRRC
jgi:hypothetical protein